MSGTYKPVLVTGATGYLGTALLPALRAAGYEPSTLAGRALARAGSLLVGVADAVVHLAAATATLGGWDANVYGTARLVRAAPRGGRFVFASTLTAQAPRTQYDREKAAGETLVQSRPDLDAVVLRLGHVYGPGQLTARSSLNRVIRQAVAGEPVALHGEAGAVRDHVYIEDAIRAFVRALAPDVPPGVYDVGTGKRGSLAGATIDLADVVPGFAYRLGGIAYGPARPVARPARWLPGWAPTVDLDDGLRRTLDWWREQRAHPLEHEHEHEHEHEQEAAA